MDKKLFFMIYNISKSNKYISKVSYLGAKMSHFIFFFIYALTAIYLIFYADFYRLKRFITIPCFILIFNNVLRKIIKRKRPFETFNIETSIEHKKAYSFPSNHSASAMAIAMAMVFINFEIGIVCIILAIFTGVSRVCTGLHFPFDVIAGWTISVFLGYIGFFLWI